MKRTTAEPCLIKNCPHEANYRGICSSHHTRMRKHGSYLEEIPLRVWHQEKKCKEDGCERIHFGRGWCNQHYNLWYKHGYKPGTKTLWTPEEIKERYKASISAGPGTRVIDNKGYIRVKVATDDWRFPMADGKGWALEHRLVIADHLRELIPSRKTVHHKNGIRNDNRLENLELWESHHPPGQRSSDPHCPTCRCIDE